MTTQPPKIPSLFEQMLSASEAAAQAKAERPPWPANPFPPGIRSGSATEKVKAVLEVHHPRWLEHCELMRLTGHSRGAISWAVKYLAEREMVRSIPSARHSSYRRYQLIKEKTNDL